MSKRYVEYILVNKDLNMSVGKIAGQVAHAQTLIDVKAIASSFSMNTEKYDIYETWLDSGQKKVILRAKESKLLRAIELGGIPVHDHGLTEIPENSLTVVGFTPVLEDSDNPSELKDFVKRLQLL